LRPWRGREREGEQRWWGEGGGRGHNTDDDDGLTVVEAVDGVVITRQEIFRGIGDRNFAPLHV
jgi:hypothetical protein